MRSSFDFNSKLLIPWVSNSLLLVLSMELATLPVVEVPPWPDGSGFSRVMDVSSLTLACISSFACFKNSNALQHDLRHWVLLQTRSNDLQLHDSRFWKSSRNISANCGEGVNWWDLLLWSVPVLHLFELHNHLSSGFLEGVNFYCKSQKFVPEHDQLCWTLPWCSQCCYISHHCWYTGNKMLHPNQLEDCAFFHRPLTWLHWSSHSQGCWNVLLWIGNLSSPLEAGTLSHSSPWSLYPWGALLGDKMTMTHEIGFPIQPDLDQFLL